MNDAGAFIPVVIVGAGPVGLSLALGLSRQGVRCVVVEKKDGVSEHSKAPGIHVRTREALRQWGVEERFLDAGTLRQDLRLRRAGAGQRDLFSFQLSRLEKEAYRPGILILEQGETERLLLEAVREAGLADVRFGAEAVDLVHHAEGARVSVRQGDDEYVLGAEFVVGCDGAGSFVRDAVDLPFTGGTYRVRPMLADVRVTDERDELGWPRTALARQRITTAIRLRPQLWRIIGLDTNPSPEGEVSGDEVSERVRETLGPGPVDTVWASRFRIHRRASPRFRVGRVILAGDAAHVHSPVGGLGMNAGIQDAHDLAWKLAYAWRGGDTDRLLDSYEVERRAVVVETISAYTDLVTKAFLLSPPRVRSAAFAAARMALSIGPVHRRAVRRATMLDLDYPASPLLDADERAAGVRLPNPLLRAPDGSEVRLYHVLGYEPVLLRIGDAHPQAAEPAHGVRVLRIGAGSYEDREGLLRRLVGADEGWILVRPDSRVAWARVSADGLPAALRQVLGTVPAVQPHQP